MTQLNPSGAAKIDHLHQDLFCSLEAVSASDDANFCPAFTTFVEQVERAFREEDMWMDDMDFPASAMHQEQHARVLGALHHVHAQVLGGDLHTGRHVVEEVLPQWLTFHVATMDTSLALAMQVAQSSGFETALQPS